MEGLLRRLILTICCILESEVLYHPLFARGQCSLSINQDLPIPQPLVLKSVIGGGFWYPSRTGILEFKAAESVRLVCAGAGNKFTNLAGNQTDVTATCLRGTTFTVAGQEMAFNNLQCTSRLSPSIRRTGRRCHRSMTDVELGYDLNNHEWITVINVCHDEERLETIYSSSTLRKEINGRQIGRDANWIQSDFWTGYDLNHLFNPNTQKATIKTLVKSSALADRYINTKKQNFLSRGHLSANSDFIYYAEQIVSFYYVNMAPQWQGLNGGNWQQLETMLYQFVNRSPKDLIVYTGIHGIAQLPDESENMTDLYLYAEGNKHAIPIPGYFWKIIYRPDTKQGTAFIGVNNPYVKGPPSNYHLCTDISSQISWLKWKYPDGRHAGISFACTVDSLRRVVSNVPPLEVVGILS